MKINVHGVEYDGVRVSENGIFSVIVDGEAFESDSLAGLRNKILYGLHQRNIEVAVPFTIVQDGLVRHGVAVGIARDDSVLVRWEHNPAQADYLIDWHHTIVTRLGEEEAEAYQGCWPHSGPLPSPSGSSSWIARST